VNRAKTARSKQENAGNQQSARIEAEIEGILATEDDLIPSSGFLASVMERVQQEAAAPPIPFPWKQAIPGILLIAAIFGWGVVELARLGLPALGSFALTPPHLSATFVRPVESAGWVALALGATLLSWLLSRRLAGHGGLL
jgi:hypothetical protein